MLWIDSKPTFAGVLIDLTKLHFCISEIDQLYFRKPHIPTCLQYLYLKQEGLVMSSRLVDTLNPLGQEDQRSKFEFSGSSEIVAFIHTDRWIDGQTDEHG